MSLTKEEYETLLERSLNHFEDRTYENLMAEFLERMPDIYDKRDGSMPYNTGAARNFEGAQQYGALDFILSQTFALSASREHLIKRASDRSIYPYPATPSVHYALFDRAGQDVPAGTRFSCEDLNFVVIEFDDDEGKSLQRTVTIDGELKLVQLVECETPGAAGNGYSGDLIPIDLITGLQKAYMYPEVHKDGTDEEETEHFRARYIEKMRSIAFAGNVADYRERILALDGVGQCKIYPEWNSDIRPAALQLDDAEFESLKEGLFDLVNAYTTITPAQYNKAMSLITASHDGKLTVGGAVKVVVAGADLTDPVVPPERIAELQEKIDPRSSAAEGDGIAPIGHLVTVASVEQVPVNITVAVTFHNTNTTAEDVQTAVEGVISKYFVDLCKKWSASGKNGVDILHSTISYLILADELLASWIRTVESVTISGTDGANKNRTLGVDEVPVLGTVTIV